MEQRLSTVAFWIGIVCTLLALVSRGLLMMGVLMFPLFASTPTSIQLSPRSFLDGAVLFFVMAIAGNVASLAKTQKTN